MLRKGPAWVVVEHRAQILNKWIRLASELESDERILHASMDSDVAKVLEAKRLLLLELGWKDLAVFTEIRDGFKLIGVQPRTGVFSPDVRPPIIQKTEFVESLPFLRPALLAKVASNGPCANAEELWRKTRG